MLLSVFLRRTMTELEIKLDRALQKLGKWRSVFAGWQLGSRPITDAECNAVRDHRDVTMVLRAEASVLLKLLVAKGVFSLEEYQLALIEEAEQLSKDYERKFPGMKATDVGIAYDGPVASETMRRMNWRP